VEFAMRLPARWKIHKGVGKYILKEALRDRLPPGVIDRPKRGFCGAASNMLQGKILNTLTADIQGSKFLREIVRPEALTALIGSSDRVLTGTKLWNLWNLVLWHRRWFE
jgi:asparagine synthase (glutamine-hydrolysing)